MMYNSLEKLAHELTVLAINTYFGYAVYIHYSLSSAKIAREVYAELISGIKNRIKPAFLGQNITNTAIRTYLGSWTIATNEDALIKAETVVIKKLINRMNTDTSIIKNEQHAQ